MIILDVVDGTKLGDKIENIEAGKEKKIELKICSHCEKLILLKKPLKTISLINFNNDRYKLVKKENDFTNTAYYCSRECRDKGHGYWVDCINPPKSAKVDDNYPEEPEGIFYCVNCRKRTNQKTIWTTCIKCKNPLQRVNL